MPKLISTVTMVTMAVALGLVIGTTATVRAQDDRSKPMPESPRTEAPSAPSAPAEAPRASEPSPSSNSSSSSSNNDRSSSSNNDNSSSSNNDSSSRDRSSRSNDSGRSRDADRGGRSNDNGGRNRDSGGNRGGNENRRSTGGESSPIRRSGDGDGSGNRRDRPPAEDVEPSPTTIRTGGNPVTPGGYRDRDRDRNGNGRDRDRDRNGGDRDRDRNRDRDGYAGRHGGHHDPHGHRNRTDDCYRVPQYDDTIAYSADVYIGTGGGGADTLSAYDQGYNDGLFTGANDARRGQTYEPERSHFYQDARHGYRTGAGGRDLYAQAYRDGFLHGYREGYQNWQRYFMGGAFHP